MKNCFLCYLVLVLFLITAVHVWASITSAYFTFLWIDIPMHFAGGAWVAAVGYYFIYRSKWVGRNNVAAPAWIALVGLIGFSAIIGIFWEFFEFGFDQYVLPHLSRVDRAQLGLADTLADLFFDMAGAFLVSVYFLYVKKSFNSGSSTPTS